MNEPIQPSLERAVLTVRVTGVDGASIAELRSVKCEPVVVDIPAATPARQIAMLARDLGPTLAALFDRDDGDQVPELVVDVHGATAIAELAFESMAFVAWRRADGRIESGRRVVRPASSRRVVGGSASQPFLDGRAGLTRTFGRLRDAKPAAVGERLRVLVVVGDLLQGSWDEVSVRDLTADAVGSARRGLDGVIDALAPLRAKVEIVVAGPAHVTGPWSRRYADLAELHDLLGEGKGWDVVHWIGHSDAGRTFHGKKIEGATGLMLRFDARQTAAQSVGGWPGAAADHPDDDPHAVRLTFADVARPLTGTRLLLLDACRLTPRLARELLRHFDHVVGHPSMVNPALCAAFTPELLGRVAGLAGQRPLGVPAAVGEARGKLHTLGLVHGRGAPVHYAADPDSKGLVGPDDLSRDTFDKSRIAALSELPQVFAEHFLEIDVLANLHVDLRVTSAGKGESARALIRGDSTRSGDGPLPDTLAGWMARERRIVLLGGPGDGKSTTLRVLAIELFRRPGFLPLYVSLDELLAKGVGSLRADLSRIDSFLSQERVDRAIALGRVVLLLDGLDEVRDPKAARRLITQLAAEVGAGWTIVASRIVGFRRLGGFACELELRALEVEQQRRFLEKWFHQLSRHAYVPARYAHLNSYGGDTDRAAADALQQVRANRVLAELARNPLMLALTAIRWALRGEQGLPDRRHRVLREMMRTLLCSDHRREDDDSEAGLGSIDRAWTLLRSVAEWLLRVGARELGIVGDNGGTHPDSKAFLEWLRARHPADFPDPSAEWSWLLGDHARLPLLEFVKRAGLFTPPAQRWSQMVGGSDSAGFPIQPFADACAAESLAQRVGLPLDAGAQPLTQAAELDAVQRLLDDVSMALEGAGEEFLTRWAETLALVTAWLHHSTSKDAWLRGLLERDAKLGLRALALAEEVPPETLAAVLEQGDASDRADYWTTIETTVGDPDAALGLLEHAVPAFPNPGDRFLIADAALRIAAADAGAETEHRVPRGERARRVAAKAVTPDSARGSNAVDAVVEAFRGQWRVIPTPHERFEDRDWYWMGSAENDESRYGDEHRRQVRFGSGWWAMEFPVTVSQWALLFPGHEQYWKGKSYRIGEWQHRALPAPDEGFVAGGLPVTTVTWFEVQGLVGALNRLLGGRIGELILGGAELWKAGWRFRLATEAEWEWMARAGSDTRYWWGDEEDGARAWWSRNSDGGVHPVRSKADESRNPFGLSHVHGLVWEWTLDAFESDETGRFGDLPDPLEAWLKRGGRASDRAQRGGSYWGEPRLCRSAYRYGGDPGLGDDGVRLVFAAPLPDSGSGIEDRVSNME